MRPDDDAWETAMRSFLEASKYDLAVSHMFEECVRLAREYYNSPETIPVPTPSDSAKVYIRIHLPTMRWYIGYTTKRDARRRHLDDYASAMKTSVRTDVYDFYREVGLNDWVVGVLCHAKREHADAARTIETRLIRYFTTETAERTLPRSKTLNMEQTTWEPRTTVRRKWKMPNILQI